jgi:type II secretory pathway component PulC
MHGRMRIRTFALVGLAALAPLGLPAFAEPAPGGRRVIGQALSNTQAVLMDEESGEYRVVRLGDTLNGARVVAIGAEDVVLIHGGTQELLKLAPDPRPRVKVLMEPMVINIKPMAAAAPAVAAAPAAAPAPGVAAAPAVAAAPVAAPAVIAAPAVAVAAPVVPPPAAPVVVAAPPHGSEPVVLSVPKNGTVIVTPPGATGAPIAAAQTASRTETTPPAAAAAPAPVAAPPVIAAPVIAAPVAPAPVAAPAPLAAPAPVAAPPPPAPLAAPAPIAAPPAPLVPAPASAPAPVTASNAVTSIPRADLERGLGDFQTLDASVAIEVAAQGGFRVAELQRGSFLNRMGLQKGDVIMRVDGRPLRTAEDASAAYNWVRVADHFVVDLVRDGQPLTLRFRVA